MVFGIISSTMNSNYYTKRNIKALFWNTVRGLSCDFVK